MSAYQLSIESDDTTQTNPNPRHAYACKGTLIAACALLVDNKWGRLLKNEAHTCSHPYLMTLADSAWSAL
jgi:hypothetical protein